MAAKKRSIFERMEDNPRADWTIEDIRSMSHSEGIAVRKPSGGSHYVLSSPHLRDSLCIPFGRPVKARYIKFLVGMVQAHRDAITEKDGGK